MTDKIPRIIGIDAVNQIISEQQLKKIRALADFDLIMLISETHDHGWPVAAKTLEWMPTKEGEKQ